MTLVDYDNHDLWELKGDVFTYKGVLGVNVNPNIKDVVADNGKVNVRGVLLVNVLGVKNVDNNTVPYNARHEIDFAKSITKK